MSSPKDIEDMYWGLQACNYSAMGALAFTIHDIVVTLQDEVEQIWKKPWTNMKYLFLFLRSLSLVSQIISAIISIKLAAGAPTTRRGCLILVGFQGMASQILMLGVQIILILRVQALYFESVFLRHLLHGLFWAEFILMTVLFIVSLPQVEYGFACVTMSFPDQALGFFLPPIAFDLFLFILTMRKFYQGVREGWGREPVINRFLRDGIWAFALPFTIVLINAFCTVFLSGAKSSVAYSWMLAVPAFAGCHLILNMSHLLKVNRSRHATTATQDVVDTVILTYDSTTFDISSYELHETTQSRAFASSHADYHL